MTASKCHLFLAVLCCMLNALQCKAEDGRIVNGDSVEIESFPFAASLQVNGSHICGAAIVSKRTLVTAAHCIVFPIKSYQVRVGSSTYAEGGILANISCIRKHPKYNSTTADYDIAVIRLKKELNFKESEGTIAAAPLPAQNYTPPANLATFVVGWGATDPEDQSTPSETLQVASLWVTTEGECKEKLTSGTLTPRMFCAQNYEMEQDACTGDSGGPMIAKGTLIGIVSWGISCADGETPGVYTNVAKVLEFIKKYL